MSSEAFSPPRTTCRLLNVSSSGASRSTAGKSLGRARTTVPFAVNNVLRQVTGLAVPLPALEIATTGALDIFASIPWVDTPSGAQAFSVAIMEDAVILNQGIISMGGTASAIANNHLPVFSHVPTAADHTYYAMVSVTGGTSDAFGESIVPVVLMQLAVKAA